MSLRSPPAGPRRLGRKVEIFRPNGPWCQNPARLTAAQAVVIPGAACPFGVLLRRTLDGDPRTGLETRVIQLGHRLADLLAERRPVLAQVLDVPLIDPEPRPPGD